jgi:hypothetical protein
MTWNYRIVTFKENTGDRYFEIRKVYYDSKGKPETVSEEGSSIFGESVKELKEVNSMMMKAFEKPVIDYDNFPEEYFK